MGLTQPGVTRGPLPSEDTRERLRLPGAPPVPRGTYATIRGREASAPECPGDTQQCQQGSAKHLVADYETLRCAQGDILLLFSLVKLHHRADERCQSPCAGRITHLRLSSLDSCKNELHPPIWSSGQVVQLAEIYRIIATCTRIILHCCD